MERGGLWFCLKCRKRPCKLNSKSESALSVQVWNRCIWTVLNYITCLPHLDFAIYQQNAMQSFPCMHIVHNKLNDFFINSLIVPRKLDSSLRYTLIFRVYVIESLTTGDKYTYARALLLLHFLLYFIQFVFVFVFFYFFIVCIIYAIQFEYSDVFDLT